MPQPPTYVRQYNFTAYQTANPTDPLPGDQVDLELNEVKDTLDAILANLVLIQRDDGSLHNNSVGLDQLKPEVVLGVPTDWVTATEYAAKAVVWQSSILYVCNTAHTSGVFATDLAAAKWTAYLDYADPLADAAAYAALAQTYMDGAETAQTAAELAETHAELAETNAEAALADAEALFATITLPWAIAQGGSGANTAAGARTAYGSTAIGDALFITASAAAARTTLGSTTVGDAVFIAASSAAGRTALGATSVGDALFIAASAAAGRTALGVTSLGDSIFTVASEAAFKALVNLEAGTDFNAYHARLADVAAVGVTDNAVLIGNGSNLILESGATLLTSIGLGTGNSPQFTGIELGHATDTTITRTAAGKILVEGKGVIKHTSSSYTSGEVTFSTGSASGGSSGDIWFKYT